MSEIAVFIDRVIHDGIAPALKAAGYRKDRRTFRRAAADGIQVVNVQASSWNSANEGRFTLNLGVYFPQVAQVLSWARVTQRPTEADCLVRERIGFLMPVGQDHWWNVSPGTDLKALGREVEAVWERHGAHWLDTHSELAAARAFAIEKKLLWWAAAVSLALGERDTARTYLEQAIGDWPPHTDEAERLRQWGQVHGLELSPAV